MDWIANAIGIGLLWVLLGVCGWVWVMYKRAKKNPARIDGEDLQVLWIAMLFGPVTWVIIWLAAE